MIALTVACSDKVTDDGMRPFSAAWGQAFGELENLPGDGRRRRRVPAETVTSIRVAKGDGRTYTATTKISSDKCRLDFGFTCPTTDGKEPSAGPGCQASRRREAGVRLKR